MKRLGHCFVQDVSACVYIRCIWKFLPGNVARVVHACVHRSVCACAHVCVLGDLICRSDHGSNLFFTFLPDKNSTLTKVFQSRKAQVPGHHSQSSRENTQMQDVTHLGQLAVKNLNANRVRGKFQGLHLWTWMPLSCQVLYGSVTGHASPLLSVACQTDRGGSTGW